MKYEHTPRPLTESHPHIRELIERQDRRAQDRSYHQDRVKGLDDRNSYIKAAKKEDTLPFYCDECREDFFGDAVLQVELDWTANQSIAFYRTKCFKGHWVMRLVTDQHKDSYFFRSRVVARDRGLHADDTLQPWETNFNLIYGRKNASQ